MLPANEKSSCPLFYTWRRKLREQQFCAGRVQKIISILLNKQTVSIFIVLQEIEDADAFHLVALLPIVQDDAG